MQYGFCKHPADDPASVEEHGACDGTAGGIALDDRLASELCFVMLSTSQRVYTTKSVGNMFESSYSGSFRRLTKDSRVLQVSMRCADLIVDLSK